MFVAPVALALLFTPDLSAVSARFGTPGMVLARGELFLTPDGKHVTDGDT
jgi:membrane glycosyltransferase